MTFSPDRVYTAVALFGGGGLFSLGVERSEPGWRGVRGKIHVVASVDAWDKASRVHSYLCPGSRSVTLDLFGRHDYEAFHGAPPSESWREATPADIRALCPEGPDILITSPPCKGFSSNLSDKLSRTPKYQALNRLTLRGLWLAFQAWADRLPRLVLLENVPRIRNRGTGLLTAIRALLRAHGYVVDDRDHDAGELGGLAQSRKRFLLAARLPGQAGFPVHLPQRRKLKSIGEVLNQLPCPLPGTSLPPMHAMPRGQHWLTALRLALIRPGRDHRDLLHVQAYEVRWSEARECWLVGAVYDDGPAAGAWLTPAGWAEAVEVGGRWAVDRETLGRAWPRETAYTVRGWDQTAGTVGASRGGATASGAPYVADPRLGCAPRAGAYGVLGWGETSPTVAASVDVHAGCAAVADPRMGVVDDSKTGEAVAHTDRSVATRLRAVSAGQARLRGEGGGSPFAHSRRDVSGHIRGQGDADRGARGDGASIPSVCPGDRERGAWVILSPGGCWHRPFTTLEVALVMGLPAKVKGAPLDLYALGLSDADARQVLGNGVPPPAAEAIGGEFGQALLESDGVVPVRLLLGGRWVQPTGEVLS